jgi:hypothetical protein
MNKFAKNIRPFVSLEIAAAAEADGDSASFMHLQRAHVLGQASTREHVRVHFRMLVWARLGGTARRRTQSRTGFCLGL